MKRVDIIVVGLFVLALGQILMGSTGQESPAKEDRITFSPEVSRIVDSLRIQFEQIEDYQVRLTVAIKMPGLRMPRKRMTLSFKQPDKVHLKALGFAMIPKSGLMLSPDSMFARISNPNLVRASVADECPCLVIKGETSLNDEIRPRIAVTIDTTRWLVTNISTRLDDEEILTLETTYIEVVPGIFMPAETNLKFEISEEFLQANPRALHTARNPDQAVTEKLPAFEASGKDSFPRTGKAVIKFSRYKVNRGLDEALFEEKE
jgi:hypothetical protein